jgi:hypothetical protein
MQVSSQSSMVAYKGWANTCAAGQQQCWVQYAGFNPSMIGLQAMTVAFLFMRSEN